MPSCDVCGEEVEFVTACKTCGDWFCAECGEVDTKQCVYCLEDEDMDDEHEEDEDEEDEEYDGYDE